VKRILTSLTAALLLAALTVPAFAVAAPDDAEQVKTDEVLAEAAPEICYYPAEVIAAEENGVPQLKKVYILKADDDPGKIDTADFERGGYTYTLLDLLKNDQTETDTKDHIEVLSLPSETKDMEKVLLLFAPTLEMTTEDGYTGTLALDHTSIAVEAAGYKTSSHTVSATRTYPNLSEADLSLVPKTTTENGRELTLADVSWESAATNTVDGYELATRYTAVATYTGTASSRYATGYTATASYTGELTKSTSDTVIYTAVFAAKEPSAAGDFTDGAAQSAFDLKWLAIPIALALAAGGYFGIQYIIKKKRGYK